MKSFLTFKALPEGLFVSTEYDTGWNESLNMSGKGGYEFTITPTDGVAEIHIRSLKDRTDDLRVVWVRGGMYFIQSKQSKCVSGFSTRMVNDEIRAVATTPYMYSVTVGVVVVPTS